MFLTVVYLLFACYCIIPRLLTYMFFLFRVFLVEVSVQSGADMGRQVIDDHTVTFLHHSSN